MFNYFKEPYIHNYRDCTLTDFPPFFTRKLNVHFFKKLCLTPIFILKACCFLIFWLCFYDCISVAVFLWLYFCDCISVTVFLWFHCCDCISIITFIRLYLVVFLWLHFVIVFLCDYTFYDFTYVIVFLRCYFCDYISMSVFLWLMVCLRLYF